MKYSVSIFGKIKKRKKKFKTGVTAYAWEIVNMLEYGRVVF